MATVRLVRIFEWACLEWPSCCRSHWCWDWTELSSYRNSWPRRQENLSKTCDEIYKDAEMVIIDGPECLIWDEASCNRGHALWLIFFKLTQHHHTWIAHVWAVLCPSTSPGIRPRLMKEQVCEESSSRGAWHPPIRRVFHRAIAVLGQFQC